jgi:anti-sigma B factor antagonist
MKITAEDREGCSVVRLQGNLVRENQGELRAFIEEVLARKKESFAIDFSGVDYIDSAGLGCCVGIHKMMCERGCGGLVIFRPSPAVEQMWRLIRLDLIIPIFPEEPAALAKLKDVHQGPR